MLHDEGGWAPGQGIPVSFEEVWNNFCLTQFFKNTIESMEEIKSLFDEARSALLKVKKLKKLAPKCPKSH